MTKKKDLLIGEDVTELGHISSVPIDTENVHVHGSTQIETRNSRKSDNPGMLPWTL